MLVMGEFNLAFFELSIVLFPTPLLLIAYVSDQIAKSFLLKGLIIYCFWLVIAFVSGLVLLTALGGASMVAAENPGLWTGRFASYIAVSLKGVVFAQPIIFLFTVFGSSRLKKACSGDT